jgi:hypothetical protein
MATGPTMKNRSKKEKIIFETPRFKIIISRTKADPEPKYLVVNKDTKVVEFDNGSLYFARDWAIQFTDALAKQDKELANGALEELKQAIVSAGPQELN